jgi:hypothetical protein
MDIYSTTSQSYGLSPYEAQWIDSKIDNGTPVNYNGMTGAPVDRVFAIGTLTTWNGDPEPFAFYCTFSDIVNAMQPG